MARILYISTYDIEVLVYVNMIAVTLLLDSVILTCTNMVFHFPVILFPGITRRSPTTFLDP
jgi:hypothetical protein